MKKIPIAWTSPWVHPCGATYNEDQEESSVNEFICTCSFCAERIREYQSLQFLMERHIIDKSLAFFFNKALKGKK